MRLRNKMIPISVINNAVFLQVCCKVRVYKYNKEFKIIHIPCSKTGHTSYSNNISIIRHNNIQTCGRPTKYFDFFGHLLQSTRQRGYSNGYLCERCAILRLKYRC